jgi:UDP-2,3-diacylglucosamine pyrophosphatase LpxH
LGSKGSNPKELLTILKKYEPEYLFLVGDIVDGWLLKRRIYWPQSNTNVIRKILSYSKSGTKVIYIPGNHDEFLREYGEISFGNIEFHDEYVYKDIFITHGDLYDGVVKLKWLGIIGSVGYDIAIVFDRFLKKLGNKRSLSKYLKDKVKGAIKFITWQTFTAFILWDAGKILYEIKSLPWIANCNMVFFRWKIPGHARLVEVQL